MSQTGASGFRRSDRGDSSLPPPIIAFDPSGEISVADNRAVADSRASTFAAVADDFAARFGLDGADDWAEDFVAQLEIDDAGVVLDSAELEATDADADSDAAAGASAESESESEGVSRPAVIDVAAPAVAGAWAGRPRRVTITGRGAEGYATRRAVGARRDLASRRELAARRPMPTLSERMGFRADRAALWAVALGLLLVLVAATSAHAATLIAH